MIHVLMCVIAYPLLTITAVMAKGKTLFWARFIVGVGCGIVGFGLGWSLKALGKAFLEAASKLLTECAIVVFSMLTPFSPVNSLGDGGSSIAR